MSDAVAPSNHSVSSAYEQTPAFTAHDGMDRPLPAYQVALFSAAMIAATVAALLVS